MARINVESYAFDDPRFEALASALPQICDRWHAMGCCLRIWHLCASRGTDTIRPLELAVCLGLARPLDIETQRRAVEAFVDIANLGDRCGEFVQVHCGLMPVNEENQ